MRCLCGNGFVPEERTERSAEADQVPRQPALDHPAVLEDDRAIRYEDRREALPGDQHAASCHGRAGEWGHNPLPFGEPDQDPVWACYCGRSGCIESLVSGPGLARELYEGLRPSDEDACRAGDRRFFRLEG